MTLTWKCDVCRLPVEDGDGWVTVDLREAVRVAESQRDFQRAEDRRKEAAGTSWIALDLAGLLDLPDEAPWKVYHRSCDPDPREDRPAYWFDVERMRTAAQVLDWGFHLQGKNWFAGTDWQGLIRRQVMPQLEEVHA